MNKPFSFKLQDEDGRERRRIVDLEQVVYVEEMFLAPRNEDEETIHVAVLHMKVTHDMQMVKKQSANGNPQEFAFAEVPMSVRVSGAEQVNRLFEAFEG